jgi:pimeloyl-ACP methyl ester carboxylesterase
MEPVVLVHGLWMHGAIMQWMARRIARTGFDTHCYTYPSVRLTMSENARRLALYAQSLQEKRVHFVGHSLGGLLIARMLEETPGFEPGRVVLMGSPFTDSYAARVLSRVRIGRVAVGASVAEWLVGNRPQNLARHEIGVIAGDRAVGLGMMVARGLPLPHDGTVTVAETEVPGAREHVVLPVSHTEMVMSPLVARYTSEFLRRGRFPLAEADAV